MPPKNDAQRQKHKDPAVGGSLGIEKQHEKRPSTSNGAGRIVLFWDFANLNHSRINSLSASAFIIGIVDHFKKNGVISRLWDCNAYITPADMKDHEKAIEECNKLQLEMKMCSSKREASDRKMQADIRLVAKEKTSPGPKGRVDGIIVISDDGDMIETMKEVRDEDNCPIHVVHYAQGNHLLHLRAYTDSATHIKEISFPPIRQTNLPGNSKSRSDGSNSGQKNEQVPGQSGSTKQSQLPAPRSQQQQHQQQQKQQQVAPEKAASANRNPQQEKKDQQGQSAQASKSQDQQKGINDSAATTEKAIWAKDPLMNEKWFGNPQQFMQTQYFLEPLTLPGFRLALDIGEKNSSVKVFSDSSIPSLQHSLFAFSLRNSENPTLKGSRIPVRYFVTAIGGFHFTFVPLGRMIGALVLLADHYSLVSLRDGLSTVQTSPRAQHHEKTNLQVEKKSIFEATTKLTELAKFRFIPFKNPAPQQQSFPSAKSATSSSTGGGVSPKDALLHGYTANVEGLHQTIREAGGVANLAATERLNLRVICQGLILEMNSLFAQIPSSAESQLQDLISRTLRLRESLEREEQRQTVESQRRNPHRSDTVQQWLKYSERMTEIENMFLRIKDPSSTSGPSQIISSCDRVISELDALQLSSSDELPPELRERKRKIIKETSVLRSATEIALTAERDAEAKLKAIVDKFESFETSTEDVTQKLQQCKNFQRVLESIDASRFPHRPDFSATKHALAATVHACIAFLEVNEQAIEVSTSVERIGDLSQEERIRLRSMCGNIISRMDTIVDVPKGIAESRRMAVKGVLAVSEILDAAIKKEKSSGPEAVRELDALVAEVADLNGLLSALGGAQQLEAKDRKALGNQCREIVVRLDRLDGLPNERKQEKRDVMRSAQAILSACEQ